MKIAFKMTLLLPTIVLALMSASALAEDAADTVAKREAALVGDVEVVNPSEPRDQAGPAPATEAETDMPRDFGEPESFWSRLKNAFAYNPTPMRPENNTQLEINALMVEGREYVRRGEYKQALNSFKEVIQRDPYNITARRYIKECQENLMQITLDDFDIVKRERLQTVERNWLLKPQGERDIEDIAGGPGATVERPIDTQILQPVASAKFSDAPLGEVFDALNQNSEPKVNINVDPIALKKLQESNQDKITLQLTEVPLIDVIRYICKAKGLLVRVDESAVVVSGKESQNLRTMVFQLSRGLDDVGDEKSTSPTAKAMALKKKLGIPQVEGASITFDARRNRLTMRDSEADINIMQDFLAKYDKTPFQVQIEARFVTIKNDDMSQLVFRHFLTKNYAWDNSGGRYNDRYNLEAPNLQREVTPGLRYIRSYMNEDSYDPLAASYNIPETISTGNSYDDYLKNQALRPQQPPYNQLNVRGAESLYKSILQQQAEAANYQRSFDAVSKARDQFLPTSLEYAQFSNSYGVAADALADANAKLAVTVQKFNGLKYNDLTANDGLGKIFDMQGVLGPAEWRTVIYALDNAEGVNTIFAPKVTVKTGQRAEIKDIIKVRYNTEIDDAEDPEIEVGDFFTYISDYAVTPKNWEEREYGTTLKVTPNVQADEKTVELDLNPEISDLIAWREFVSSRNNIFELPQFFVQSVRTVVRVNDGDTVVMGGLMRDNLVKTDDKTPILGDLPLIGRFWRGTSEVARKSNLMIFVNAKLIDPSGKARQRAAAVR
jgi:type II secretory pathway component GspD/PulD (secretin)